MEHQARGLFRVGFAAIASSFSLVMLSMAYAALTTHFLRGDLEGDWNFLAGVGYVLPVVGAAVVGYVVYAAVGGSVRSREGIVCGFVGIPGAMMLTVALVLTALSEMDLNMVAGITALVGCVATVVGAAAVLLAKITANQEASGTNCPNKE